MLRPLALSLALAAPALAPAHAGGGMVDGIVLGVLAHEIASDDEGGVDVNLEVRLRPLFGRDWAVAILPTAGATVNLGGDTDTAYLGATARYALTPSLDLEGFLGLAIHDARTPNDVDRLDLGCRILFREGAGIVYRRGAHTLGLYASHASHGGILCGADENDGMTGAGLRYGYRF